MRLPVMRAAKRNLAAIGLGLLCLAASGFARAAEIPIEAAQRLAAGEAVDLIVEYAAPELEQAAASRRQHLPRRIEDDALLAERARQYAELKRRVDDRRSPGVEHLADYSHLPLAFKRFRSAQALLAYARRPEVRAIHLDGQLRRVLAQSLPLIAQPAAAAVGNDGTGTTVAVADDGIDYTRSEFGCTAPGVPASCRVSVSLSFGSGSSSNVHGTNVSAVALGTAPGSRIAMLNVFSGDFASSSTVIMAINWAIANRSTHNIVALNLSLGDGVRYTSSCSKNNPYVTPVANARNAGITVVASAGNEAYTDGLAKPACTPGVVSVGAVYDTNVGGLVWGSNLCTDTTTAADKVTCFSNSAGFLTLLAPGALITAGGATIGGTSQAAPHVAGAVAVLRAGYPAESLDESLVRLTGNGVSVADPRNGLVKPRLDLAAALRPANDRFAGRFTLAGNTGSAIGQNRLATAETGEPWHAGVGSGHSVWWRWVAPSAGQFSLDTRGSAFDTVLAVYTGNELGGLQQVAANDNGAGGGSAVLFQAQAGVEYQIAIDGNGSAVGDLSLHWTLTPGATANLWVSLDGPSAGIAGGRAAYTASVGNGGPQTATGVTVNVTLPANASVVALPTGCTQTGATLNCLLGDLASGAASSVAFEIAWSDLEGPASLAISAASDLPDSAPADNATTRAVSVLAANDADVPTLPEWAAIVLGLLLFGSGTRRWSAA